MNAGDKAILSRLLNDLDAGIRSAETIKVEGLPSSGILPPRNPSDYDGRYPTAYGNLKETATHAFRVIADLCQRDVEDAAELRRIIVAIAEDNSPYDAQATAQRYADQWGS